MSKFVVSWYSVSRRRLKATASSARYWGPSPRTTKLRLFQEVTVADLPRARDQVVGGLVPMANPSSTRAQFFIQFVYFYLPLERLRQVFGGW